MQHDDAVDALPSYPDALDNEKAPSLLQEKWADIEATLPPYEPRARSIRPRIRSRKQCIRIALIVLFVVCLITPATVIGVVYGLRSQHKTQNAPELGPIQAPEPATISLPTITDGAIATGADGKPLRGPKGFATATLRPGATVTRPPVWAPAPTPAPIDEVSDDGKDKHNTDSAAHAPERV
ncbi:hypothetical protein AURDEDRAFT_117257 [Auricularia subglabra TFB-10046 SS5]|nr:hypothetical protein AURDEDRAFT_117257 [Auricularia subglabra TFB-10046 SS5]